MPQQLPAVDETQAAIILQKLVDRFGPAELTVKFQSDACGEYMGCYDPEKNILYFPASPKGINTYVLAHEHGHAIERSYAGSAQGENFSYMQGEGFARAFESIWMLTEGRIQDWRCQKCQGIRAHLMPDNSISCASCGSAYYVSTYLPQDFRNAPPQTGMKY